jgi:hypothetical protein
MSKQNNYYSIRSHIEEADKLARAGHYMASAEQALSAAKVSLYFEAESTVLESIEKNRTKRANLEKALKAAILDIKAYHIDWALMNNESPDYDPKYKPAYPPIVEQLEKILKANS